MPTVTTDRAYELDSIQLAGFRPNPLLSSLSCDALIEECVFSLTASFDHPDPVVRKASWDFACQTQMELIARARGNGSMFSPCDEMDFPLHERLGPVMREIHAKKGTRPARPGQAPPVA